MLQCGLSLLQSAACYGAAPVTVDPLQTLNQNLCALTLELVDRVPAVERVSLIVEVVLPFLAGVHCVTGQQVPLDQLLVEATPHLCRDSLVPLLQILQSKVRKYWSLIG